MTSAPWPLFDLRLRTGSLVLRLPGVDDLAALIELAKAGIHPPEEMPFGFAWTDQPSPEFDRNFFQFHVQQWASWRPDEWSLPLGVWVDGSLAGVQELSATSFATMRTVLTGSWLGQAFQGRGIGTLMRQAVLALAFDHLDAEVAESGGFFDNPASLGVSRAIGYRDNGIGRLAPRGVARETQRFRLSRDDWRARERPEVGVEGLEPCLELFGLPPRT
ncbi:MAG TPA: GNAT family protein [Candidatus Limnocylindrales bacterium]